MSFKWWSRMTVQEWFRSRWKTPFTRIIFSTYSHGEMPKVSRCKKPSFYLIWKSFTKQTIHQIELRLLFKWRLMTIAPHYANGFRKHLEWFKNQSMEFRILLKFKEMASSREKQLESCLIKEMRMKSSLSTQLRAPNYYRWFSLFRMTQMLT